MRAYLAPLITASAIALTGCAYGYGDYGYGSGYRDYGYYNPYYYGGFGTPYSSSYYGSSPYFGWYGSSYYPGTGIYVYDSYRRPRVWTSGERSYWSSRQATVRTSRTVRTQRVRPNWSGFNQRATAQTQRQERRRNRNQ